MAWEPKQDESAVSVAEFLRIAERKYPGISRNPLVQQALEIAPPGDHSIKDMLAAIDPVRLRANARLRGYLPALTDEQHTLVFKRHTGVRTRYVTPKSNPGINLSLLRKRRNYGPGADVKALAGLFNLFAKIYVTDDRATIALREMLQNSTDAINAPRVGSIALGQIKKGEGQIDVIFDRKARTLTVSDNGCGMNPKVICKFTTLGGSTKGGGDEGLTAAQQRELYPPMTLTVRAFLRESEYAEPPQNGRYWIRVNGLYQFDVGQRNAQYLLPADYVFDYKAPSIGGFGAAKAIIFLASKQDKGTPPRWDMHTQDNYYDGEMAHQDTKDQVCATTGTAAVRKVPHRQGTKITIYDLDESVFDRLSSRYTNEGAVVQGSFDSIETRMKRVLEASTVPNIRITFNGEEVVPRFANVESNKVKWGDDGGSWTDGIFTYPTKRPSPPEYILQQLVGTTSDPQEDTGYPFTPGRDTFAGSIRPAFAAFQKQVEIDPESLKARKVEGLIVFDPLDTSGTSVENTEVQALLKKAGEGEDFQRALEEAAKLTIESKRIAGESVSRLSEADELRRQQEEAEREERARTGQYGRPETKDQRPSNTEAETQQITQASEQAEQELEQVSHLPQEEQLSEKERILFGLAETLASYLHNLNKARVAQDMKSLREVGRELGIRYLTEDDITYYVREIAQDRYPINALTELYRMQAIVQRASLDAGGGGLLASASFDRSIAQIVKICEISPRQVDEAKERAGVTNPLGGAALLVERGNFTRVVSKPKKDWRGKIEKDEYGNPVMENTLAFDEVRYRKFQRNAAKYLPLLFVWDRLVRMIAGLSGRKYPLYQPIATGFVLNDSAYAVFYSGSRSNMVLINPIWATNAIKTYRNAGDLAVFLHALACHEMAHMYRGKSHKDGHDEEFSVIREHLAIETLGALPVITPMVAEWSKLRNPYSKEPVAAMKQRYRAIAEEVTCPACLKEAVESLEKTGRLDTVRWIKERMGWESSDLSDRSHDEIE